MTDPDLRVRQMPDPVLARPGVVVDATSPEIVSLAARMVELMRVSPRCVGVAAPQVGESLRLFVLDVGEHKLAKSRHGLVVLANPSVVERSGEHMAREGCLSVPDLTGDVPRSTEIVVSGIEPATGRVRVVEADAFEARALQHELDHLDGLLFLDRVRNPAGLHQRRSFG